MENQPRIDQPTSSDRSIKKRGRLVLQKCPGNVVKPFCGNVLTPLMSGIALRQFSQTTFSLRGNLIIKSWNAQQMLTFLSSCSVFGRKQTVSIGAKAANRKQFSKNKNLVTSPPKHCNCIGRLSTVGSKLKIRLHN